jgi:hypothetical protein
MNDEDKSGFIELGAGSGSYIGAHGEVTQDKSRAMWFSDAEDAKRFLDAHGWTAAVLARQAIPADKRLPVQFEL